jgi:hypothetical protein
MQTITIGVGALSSTLVATVTVKAIASVFNSRAPGFKLGRSNIYSNITTNPRSRPA